MHHSSYDQQPEAAAAIDLFDLVVSGPLRRVESHPDGSWTVTPTVGAPVLLTDPAQVAAYVATAHGTGPQALAPVAPTGRPAAEPAEACGCVPAVRTRDHSAEVMQALAVHHLLAEWIAPARRSAAWDEDAQAAAVRIESPHGLYQMFIPAPGRPFPVFLAGRRDGTLGVRRGPGTSDGTVAALLACYLRDRGDLDQ